METRKKALKKDYQTSHRQMGIYQIRNLTNDKVMVGQSLNLPAIFNRSKLQLRNGTHPNRQLQIDWRELGEEKFAFEILDEISPNADPARDYREELNFLEDLWLENLQPYEPHGYNERKKSREERLRMIAQNRLRADHSS